MPREAIVIDMHDDVLNALLSRRAAGEELSLGDSQPDFQSDIPRWRAGGVDAVFLPVYTNPGDSHFQKAMAIHAELQRQIALNPDDLEQASSADDIERISGNGKIAAILAIEGGHIIENSLANLRELHRLGYRYLGLTHDVDYEPYELGTAAIWAFDWADPNHFPNERDEGLKEFGRSAVEEAVRLGIMVDLAHASYLTKMDALDVVANRAPVIATHDAAFALHPIYRTTTDDVLKRIAESGGFAGVYFIPHLLNRGSNSERPTIQTVLDHLDHFTAVMGTGHVAVGSDFNGVPKIMLPFPEGIEDAAALPHLTEGMIERGYSCGAIRDIWGANVLRALRATSAAADQ